MYIYIYIYIDITHSQQNTVISIAEVEYWETLVDAEAMFLGAHP